MEIERAAGRRNGKSGETVLPFPPDTRERLTALYRERDEFDAARHASGAQKVRAEIWAIGLRRLERGDEVYESLRVLASAGIELPPAAKTMLEEMPNDWRQICMIQVRTASSGRRR